MQYSNSFIDEEEIQSRRLSKRERALEKIKNIKREKSRQKKEKYDIYNKFKSM